jgi:predicted negative regulator of RcsB-dependent stress response
MEADKTQTPQATETFDIFKWTAWLHANLKTVITSVVAVAVISMAIALYSWKKNQDEQAASKAFAEQPGVVLPEKGAHPNTDALLKIASEYPGTSAGVRAHLLAAETLFADGKYDPAHAQFTKFLNDQPSSPWAAQASYGVAASLEGLGKIDEAIKNYQDVAIKFPGAGVTGPAKLTIARLYEEQNKLDLAVKAYDELIRSSGRDLWGSEAHERQELLFVKHPELRPTPTTATPAQAAPVAAAAPAVVKAPAAAPAPAKNTNAAAAKH